MSDNEVGTAAITTKRVVFVGGIVEEATKELVRAAMIPFGPIQVVDMVGSFLTVDTTQHLTVAKPLNYSTGKHKGFAFVEYQDPDHAQEAIFNMDGAELAGRYIRVTAAQANQMHKLSLGNNEAIWNSDEWYRKQAGGQVQEKADSTELEEA